MLSRGEKRVQNSKLRFEILRLCFIKQMQKFRKSKEHSFEKDNNNNRACETYC